MRENANGPNWAAISFLLKHEDRKSSEGVPKRLEAAIKALDEIKDLAEARFHPELDRENVAESSDWKGWGYALGHRKRKPEGEKEGTTPRRVESPDDNALALYDDDGDARISCAEGREHEIAPVHRSHPAYRYMHDGDGDGIVCE